MKTVFRPFIFWLLAHQLSYGQISPGPLSSVHSALEGISNCTECHESGKEISGAKCVACHGEIKKQIDRRHGYHFENSVSACIICHKEHLGKDVKITRFDEKQFDHAKTGFTLSGKHAATPCERCHTAKNIIDLETKKILAENPHKTYLGLDQQCVSCHQDRHKGSVGTQCQTCHGATSWFPAEVFDHQKTKFTLVGKHKPVLCVKCHDGLSTKTSTGPILFSTKSSVDCTPCHASPHGKKFSEKKCRSCHSPEGWSIVVSFDHSSTQFALVGKHTSVPCEKCHTEMNARKGGIVSFKTKKFEDCTPCHSTPHNSKFLAYTCISCHTTTGWRTLLVARFDHSLTKYELVGKHGELQCEQCHKSAPYGGFSQKFLLPHTLCTDCHSDFHKGQFRDKYSNDCAQCHTEKGYKPSTFSIAKHAGARFPLSGAHNAIPCEQCHKKSGTQEPVFRFESLRCESCHVDVHKGQFSEQMAERSCAQCHSTKDWTMASFDHSKTGFPLVGLHSNVKCSECHRETFVNAARSVHYKGIPKDCQSCHRDVHVGQFAVGGVTRCVVCHNSAGWHLLLFDHEKQSSFHLTGAHKKVECGGCHKEERFESQAFIRYKPLSSRCESCHQGVR